MRFEYPVSFVNKLGQPVFIRMEFQWKKERKIDVYTISWIRNENISHPAEADSNVGYCAYIFKLMIRMRAKRNKNTMEFPVDSKLIMDKKLRRLASAACLIGRTKPFHFNTFGSTFS